LLSIPSSKPCITCSHSFEVHETSGAATGSFYCRSENCLCKSYSFLTKVATKSLLCPNCEETLGTVLVTVPAESELDKLEIRVAVSCTEISPGVFTHTDIDVERVNGAKVLKVEFSDSWSKLDG